MGNTSEPERRYFTANPTRYGQAIGAIGSVFMAVALFLPGVPLVARIWAGVSLVLFVACFLRALRLGVYSSRNGLRVHNTFKTHELDWEQIEGFTIGITRWNGIAAIVRCADGRELHCSGVQHPWMSTVECAWDSECGSIVMHLERDLARFRDTSQSHDGASVCLAPCLAHGTAATTTPCSTQCTRGTCATMWALVRPKSSVRHRRVGCWS